MLSMAEEKSGDSPLKEVTQIPNKINNNHIKVKATVHNHTINGDIITNGISNCYMSNGSIPNGHVIGRLKVGTREVNRAEGILIG